MLPKGKYMPHVAYMIKVQDKDEITLLQATRCIYADGEMAKDEDEILLAQCTRYVMLTV